MFTSARISPAFEPGSPDPVCYHCGSTCDSTRIVAEEKHFCCNGCLTVYTLLQAHQLEGYYGMGEAHPGKQKTEAGQYAWLDQEEMSRKLLDYQDEKLARLRLRLPDMHCAACIWLLEQLYRIQPGISRSEVDFPRREIALSYDPQVLSLRQVVELLDVLGYPPALSLADADDKPTEKRDRRLWYALGIAGFCFGNIMLLSFPEYLNLNDPALARVFRWLNLVLSLPVVLYSARTYYKSAWTGLKHGMINMDVPITIGIAVLFMRSSYDVVFSLGSGYFDSLAGLVFFLLIGRAYQRKTYHLLAFDRDYRSYFPIAATRMQNGEEATVGLSELGIGDQVLVRNGELIPADARILEGDARIDYSFVTGESELVKVEPGAQVYAGGRQYGAPLHLVLEKEVAQGYLTRLWGNAAFQKQNEAEVSHLSEKIARRFTPAVLLIALVAAIVWAFIDAGQIWNIVTAVLIVACPCALALSTPFTFGHLLRVFGRMGLFLKGPAVVESMAGIDKVVFDKTGTLTETRRSVVSWHGRALQDHEIEMVRSVLRGSIHPLSRRLHAALPEGEVQETVAFREEKGRGLYAEVGGQPVWLGSALHVGEKKGAETAGAAQVYFRKGDEVVGRWEMRQAWREGMEELVDELAAEHGLGVLTGDHDGSRQELESLMPAGTEMRFRQSPAEKLAWVKELQEQGGKVAMVGDGLNDAGALQQSEVGIALTDDLSAFTPASDGILRGESLRDLPLFLGMARKGIRLIYASFAISFLYNIVGIGFAVTGHLSPLVAAILMPASSVSVVLFTTLGVRVIALRARKKQKDITGENAPVSPFTDTHNTEDSFKEKSQAKVLLGNH